MRPYQIVGDRADPAEDRDLHQLQAARHPRRRRLRLAHHRLGQDADQSSRPRSWQRSLPTSTRCCSSSTARTSTTRPCASTTASRRARPTRTRRPRVLKQQLEDPSARIIITTIQKLADFIAANKGHAIYDGHVVIIFDECHRSQFGDMHTAITKAFKRYNLFGFTGTPIFAENAGTRRQPAAAHHRAGVRRASCTPTRSSTRSTTRTCCRSASTTSTPSRCRTASPTSRCRRSTPSRRCSHPERMRQVVDYIARALRPEDQAQLSTTRSASGASHGFNALFATASIDAAKRYYARVQEAAGVELPAGPAG